MGTKISYRASLIVVVPRRRRSCEWRFYLPGHTFPAVICGFSQGRQAMQEAIKDAQRAVDRCLAGSA